MIEKRSPSWLRLLEILAGVLVLLVAFFVLADSGFALYILAYALGIGLFILGLSRIFASAYGRYFAPWFREVNAGGGIIALVLGSVVIIDPQLAIGFLTLLVAFAVLVVGIVEIVAAGFAKHPTCLGARSNWRSGGLDCDPLSVLGPGLVLGTIRPGNHNGDSVGCSWSSRHCPWGIRASSGQN